MAVPPRKAHTGSSGPSDSEEGSHWQTARLAASAPHSRSARTFRVAAAATVTEARSADVKCAGGAMAAGLLECPPRARRRNWAWTRSQAAAGASHQYPARERPAACPTAPRTRTPVAMLATLALQPDSEATAPAWGCLVSRCDLKSVAAPLAPLAPLPRCRSTLAVPA